jgi:hypothetical protein
MITDMQALDLLSSVASTGAIAPSRVKDIKTAINKLAQACQLPPDELDLVSLEATYPDILKTYFTTLGPSISTHTIRNTIQNLGQLYRAAHASMLIVDTRSISRPRLPTDKRIHRELLEQSPYKALYSTKAMACYRLPLTQWPADIAQSWQAYAVIKALQVRQISFNVYTDHLSQYMGYNLRYDSFPPSRWDQLFEIPRLMRYLAWKSARVGAERISSHGLKTVVVLVDIAKHQERPDYLALQKFKRSLPRPAARLNKKAPRHTVALVDLDRLGLTLMAEARQPLQRTHDTTRLGLNRAQTFATGLIIRFMVRCPRRQKEIREMDFGDRLDQDDRGIWWLHYKSHQLKIAMHDGQPNEFRMEWPPDLVDDLTEYLQVFRPMILGPSVSSIVFPTRNGKMITRKWFWRRIAVPCWGRLRKHVFPHLLRTLWCDAYLDAHPGDFEGAAAMLNDTVETVQSWYRQFRVEQQLKKATDFNAALFGNGPGKGKTR